MNGDISTLSVALRLIHCPLIKNPFKRSTKVKSYYGGKTFFDLNCFWVFVAIMFFFLFLLLSTSASLEDFE